MPDPSQTAVTVAHATAPATTPGPSVTGEDEVSALLLRWQDLPKLGQDVPAADLCRDRPDLLPELEQRIATLDEVRRQVSLSVSTPTAASADKPPSTLAAA